MIIDEMNIELSDQMKALLEFHEYLAAELKKYIDDNIGIPIERESYSKNKTP